MPAAAVVVAGGAAAEQGLDGAGQGQQLFDFVVVGVGNEQLAPVPGDADGVLEADIVFHAVAVAEGEQVNAHQGGDAPGGGVNAGAADAAGFGVGEVEDGVAGAILADDDAAGLRQGSGGQGAVVNVFGAGAGVGLHDAVVQSQAPKLVDAGHRDIQGAVVMRQVPGAAQSGLGAGAGGAAVVPLPAGAGDGVHLRGG